MIVINAEYKIKNAINWIEALLSGKYKQGRRILGDEKGGYCCWGVGCKVAKVDFDPLDIWNDDLYEAIGFIKLGSSYGELYTELDNNTCLSEANDIGVPFKDIANHLVLHADEQFEPEVAVAVKEHFKDIKA